ncbi:MAG: hypothetical protein NVS3B3_04550 [Aquirhabdus sp.]
MNDYKEMQKDEESPFCDSVPVCHGRSQLRCLTAWRSMTAWPKTMQGSMAGNDQG